MAYQPTPTDRRLERLIEAKMIEIRATRNRAVKRALWREYADLKAKRSPAMVTHIERELGLAP